MINLPRVGSIFWRNVGKLVTGTILAQLTAIVALPIITRIYSPSEIGILSILNSLAGTIIIIGSLRLERAIVVIEKSKAFRLSHLCFYLLCLISLITFISLYFFHGYFQEVFGLPQGRMLFIVPAIILLKGLYNILSNLSNSFESYRALSLAIIATSIIGYSLKIFLANFFYASFQSLIISELIATAISAFILIFSIPNKSDLFSQIPSWNFIKRVYTDENDFLKYDNFTSLLNNFSWLMPVFFLSIYFNNSIVGFYSLGFMLLRLPMNLLGKAIGNVFYKSSSMKESRTEIAIESVNVFTNLLFFGIFPTFIIVLFGEELFSLFLGVEWSEAGVYSQILAVWTLIWFISSPLSNLYYTLTLQKYFLWFMAFSVVLRGLSFVIGGEIGNIYLSLWLFSITSILVYAYQIIFLFGKLNVSTLVLSKEIINTIRPTLIPISVLFLLHFLNFSFIIKLILIGTLMAWVFYSRFIKSININ